MWHRFVYNTFQHGISLLGLVRKMTKISSAVLRDSFLYVSILATVDFSLKTLLLCILVEALRKIINCSVRNHGINFILILKWPQK